MRKKYPAPSPCPTPTCSNYGSKNSIIEFLKANGKEKYSQKVPNSISITPPYCISASSH